MKRTDLIIVPFALLFGLLMLLPNWYAMRTMGDAFQGIYHFNDEDAAYYIARIEDVRDEHPFLGNPYIAELKDKPAMQFFLPDWLMALPLMAFGIDSTPQGVHWTLPLWGMVLFLSCYAGLRTYTGSVFWSTLGAVGIFGFRYPGYWDRPVSPLGMLPLWFALFGVLAAWMRSVEHGTGMGGPDPKTSARRYAILAAILFGIQFYVYPYGWTFYSVLLTLLAGAAAITMLAAPPKTFLFVLLGGYAIGAGYFVSTLRAASMPDFGESITRLGMITTHFPSGIKVVFPSVIIAFAYFMAIWKKVIPPGPRALFAVCGLAAVSIAVNQHIVTGKNLEFSSHYIATAIIWSGIALTFFAFAVERVMSTTMRTIFRSAAVCSIALLVVSTQMLTGALAETASARHVQRYAPALEELQKRTAKDDAVYANMELSLLIPMYTHANIFFDRHANLFFISDKEVRDRFLIHSYFTTVDAAYLRNFERSVWGVRYIDQVGHATQINAVRTLFGLQPKPLPKLPDSEVSDALARSNELHAAGFQKALAPYRVDWLVWDTQKDPEWALVDTMPFLEYVATAQGGFRIYRVGDL